MFIRKIQTKDFDTIIKHRREEQFSIYGNNIEYSGFEKDMREFLSNIIANKEYLGLVAEEHGEIAATALFHINAEMPEICNNGRYAYMGNCYTLPEYRNKGYLKKIISEAIELLKKENVSFVFFESDSNAMIRASEHFGFKHNPDFFTLELC